MLTAKEKKNVLANELKNIEVKLYLAETDLKYLHQQSISTGEQAYGIAYDNSKVGVEVLRNKRDYYTELCK